VRQACVARMVVVRRGVGENNGNLHSRRRRVSLEQKKTERNRLNRMIRSLCLFRVWAGSVIRALCHVSAG